MKSSDKIEATVKVSPSYLADINSIILSSFIGGMPIKKEIVKREVIILFIIDILVRPTGFEPVAFGTGIQCSIQLSYGRICVIYRRETH